MYEPNGNPTTDPTKAKCGKRRDNCQQHFGFLEKLPMFAFPGVGRVS
jgi:phage-related protein